MVHGGRFACKGSDLTVTLVELLCAATLFCAFNALSPLLCFLLLPKLLMNFFMPGPARARGSPGWRHDQQAAAAASCNSASVGLNL